MSDRKKGNPAGLTDTASPCGGIVWWGWLLGAAAGSIIAIILITWWKEAQQAADHIGPKSSPPPVIPPTPGQAPLTPVTASPSATPPDNLARVKGIGPKISALLKERGITTFDQLAQADVGHLRALLAEWDWRFIDPTTWPEQAREFSRAKADK